MTFPVLDHSIGRTLKRGASWVEPLARRRRVVARRQRTPVDWAEEIDHLLSVDYPDAATVVLVMDDLNTHPRIALRDLRTCQGPSPCPAIPDPPGTGSWLNIAEIGLSALTRQSLHHQRRPYPTPPPIPRSLDVTLY